VAKFDVGGSVFDVSAGFRAGVADVLRFAEINEVLRHVFGVVGDALKAFYRRPSNSGSG
jgi:hypothetical protein